MASISETTLSSWTGPASDAEDERYDNARKAIAKAIDARKDVFKDANLEIYAKGSYPNSTNVVRDSDVDVAVEMTGTSTRVLRGTFVKAAPPAEELELDGAQAIVDRPETVFREFRAALAP